MPEAYRLFLLPREMLKNTVKEINQDIHQLEVSLKHKKNLVLSLEQRASQLEQLVAEPLPQKSTLEEVKV